MRQTRSFAHTPDSVPAARKFVSAALAGGPGDALDSVALMVSELASNCIRHTDSGFDLSLCVTRDEIRVEVTDSGGGEPRVRHPGPTDPSGRGLQIVDMLATHWGVDVLPGAGKTVWFSITAAVPAKASWASA